MILVLNIAGLFVVQPDYMGTWTPGVRKKHKALKAQTLKEL